MKIWYLCIAMLVSSFACIEAEARVVKRRQPVRAAKHYLETKAHCIVGCGCK